MAFSQVILIREKERKVGKRCIFHQNGDSIPTPRHTPTERGKLVDRHTTTYKWERGKTKHKRPFCLVLCAPLR